ncbi:MAG: TrmH family RNA methyltransferase [Rhodospirillaceae bacterium]|nr:MAG: TrmH family RNA methyltransferase [Rhodospirillaceae bacterium]
MRGYFGIGVEGINKPFNVGNLFRTAHAFDASFVFTVAATYRRGEVGQSDTSDALANLPFYAFPSVADLLLPKGCALVGVELLDGAVELPSFTHPRCAAYVLGPERSSLSPALVARCDHLLRIPTRFCLNVGIAGALVMYDRLLTAGRFAPRPVMPGGPDNALMARFRTAPPLAEVALAARGGHGPEIPGVETQETEDADA